ncbi:anti-CBASS protein Acb1 family protein [Candidatus Borreliella tachyglossi]|uniref:anti-CBASS protein Acb1 family protein n=1 Tax=Candidatus Borreliella tachyglossi TaxID=1964448 RepID=UPI0040431DF4
MKLDININSRELYLYSIFFRNYIENVGEDALKNGISLLPFGGGSDDTLASLKIELKEALLNAIISYRFYGVGYILVQTNDDYSHLESEVNNELPIGFTFLENGLVNDRDFDSNYITYNLKVRSLDENHDERTTSDDETVTNKEIRIHKSRLIIYDNFDHILGKYTPVYTQNFLLNIYLLERIYVEIEKRISNHNFLFYKDEYLVELQDALTNATASIDLITKSNSKSGNIFSNLLKGSKNDQINANITAFRGINNELDRELARLKSNLNNEGIFYTGTQSANLQVIKYDLAYLKDAFELVKAKIGADTKEPLTRSFNEQTKGLGSDGKGDRSNYYDFIKGVQENVENACNIKLNKHYGLDMRFNSIVVLSEDEKLERDNKLMDTYNKYLTLVANNTLDSKYLDILNRKLFFLEDIT